MIVLDGEFHKINTVLTFIVLSTVLIYTLENGLAVRNISSYISLVFFLILWNVSKLSKRYLTIEETFVPLVKRYHFNSSRIIIFIKHFILL